jgi:multiple sugar transport system substrate-binding protein
MKSTIKRRTLIKLAGAGALASSFPSPSIAQGVTLRWWYHFDNPQNSPAAFVKRFEEKNPGIRIQAEAIPWGGGTDYATRIFASAVAGNLPDTGLVRLSYLSQLMEMDALTPLSDYIKNWSDRGDIPDDLWKLNTAKDGKLYYMPAHYVVLYLCYRTDLFQQAGLQPPKTFEEFRACAKALTKGDVYGFGMRGAAGGFDNWGPFVLGGGASFDKGGMVTEKAIKANEWYVNLFRQDKVTPPSAPTDAFRQIVDGFKAGRTAMVIHHLTSANEMVAALGDDKVGAVPVPKAPDGKAWTIFGDESNAIFSTCKNKEAAFKWISFLSSNEGNMMFTKETAQLTVTKSGAANWTLHPKRFVDASLQSLPFSSVLPDSPKTVDFVRTVWPTNMQRALLGEISPADQMRAYEKHYHG